MVPSAAVLLIRRQFKQCLYPKWGIPTTSDLALDHTTETTKWEKLIKSKGLSVNFSAPLDRQWHGILEPWPAGDIRSVTFQSLPIPSKPQDRQSISCFFRSTTDYTFFWAMSSLELGQTCTLSLSSVKPCPMIHNWDLGTPTPGTPEKRRHMNQKQISACTPGSVDEVHWEETAFGLCVCI